MPRAFSISPLAGRLVASMLLTTAPGMARAAGAPVILAQHPGTELDCQARRLMVEDLHTATTHGERPVLLTGSGQLSDDPSRTALFVQVQSVSLCGSAGCSTSVYLPDARRNWTRVLDSVSGPVVITPQTHDGMHDLLVDGTDRWVWNGTTYTDTQATTAP